MTTSAILSHHIEQAHRYRENGWWRDGTFLDDLATWARVQPDAPAFVTGDCRAGTVNVMTYRELDEHVRRFASGLHDLGIREGDVVAVQLPDWWQTPALLLACMRLGAIAGPLRPEFRALEVEKALARTKARMCITVDSWDGFEHSRALAEMAPRLPHLRHRVVYGDAGSTGSLDFDEHFVRNQESPDLPPVSALDPDQPCLVLFTSGSTGEAKGVLHSFNTVYAGTKGFTAATALAPGADRAAGTLRMTHIAGPLWMMFGTLLSGGAGVFQDGSDADQLLDLMERAEATRLLATPPRLRLLVEAQRRRPRRLDALHTVAAGATMIPTELVPAVREAFGVPLRAAWGMTEIVVGTVVGSDDPPDWSAHSDGRALPGLELRIVTANGEEGTGALHVRGAALCLGTITGDIDHVSPPTDTADGWFDTGDLARSDGRGGIRIMGRVADRIYHKAGSLMIPVRDVEDELLLHPNVRDVAIIACTDGDLEDVCAVVVPSGEPPTLDSLCEFLSGRGMTDSYHPTRLECVDTLPRDPLGKVRKYQLRAQLDPAAPAGSPICRH